jgi:hypothetical protein
MLLEYQRPPHLLSKLTRQKIEEVEAQIGEEIKALKTQSSLLATSKFATVRGTIQVHNNMADSILYRARLNLSYIDQPEKNLTDEEKARLLGSADAAIDEARQNIDAVRFMLDQEPVIIITDAEIDCALECFKLRKGEYDKANDVHKKIMKSRYDLILKKVELGVRLGYHGFRSQGMTNVSEAIREKESWWSILRELKPGLTDDDFLKEFTAVAFPKSK